MRVTADIIIAIDPDVSKCGVAILDTEDNVLEVSSFDIAETYGYIKNVQEICTNEGKELVVIVEAGWMNKTNWHTSWNDRPNVAAKKGLAVGRNQQVGHDLITFLTADAITTIPVPPLRKMWRGADRKITHEELVAITGLEEKRTNQEERDAALLAWVYAGLPIRTSCRK